MKMSEDPTSRLRARNAYLGIRELTPRADLLPKQALPWDLHDRECYDVSRFVVQLVRAKYVRCRKEGSEVLTHRPNRYGGHELRHWDGGYDWQGKYHVPIWMKIAAAILERGFDVEGYIETAFARAADAGTPYPNKLLSLAALEHYEREELPEVVRQSHIARRCTETDFLHRISDHAAIYRRTRGDAALAVLGNPTDRPRGFYRYWVAAQLDPGDPKLRRIRETYRGQALGEYVASVRAYEAAYGPLTDFRLTISIVRHAFVELAEGDQTAWTPPPVEGSCDPDHRGPDEPEGALDVHD
jgi:hypothetical protein